MDGKPHELITVMATVPVAAATFSVTGSYQVTIDVSLGMLTNVIMNPDLDLIGVTRAETNMMKIPIVGYVWMWIWLPYAHYIPHRSHWSHSIYGTFLRVIYLVIYLLLHAALIDYAFDTSLLQYASRFILSLEAQRVIVWLFGLWIADILHLVGDSKKVKKWREIWKIIKRN